MQLVNQSYGDLVVLEDRGYTGKGHCRTWYCRCPCGKEFETTDSNVKRGLTKSCGCLREKMRRTLRWTGYGKISGRYWSRVRIQAEKRNIEFSVTIEEAWSQYLKQEGKCALTGWDLVVDLTLSGVAENTASLDRKDSKLGYTPDNIQWVHKHVNRMKWQYDEDYFIKLCRAVAEYATGGEK